MDIRGIALNFEAVKIAMTQDKNGHVLKLSIHPDDTPEAVMRDPVGQRYMVALVRLDDENKPVSDPATEEGKHAVQSAAMLCKDDRFQEWLRVTNEEEAAASLTQGLGIKSRSELATNKVARDKFRAWKDEFAFWLRNRR